MGRVAIQPFRSIVGRTMLKILRSTTMDSIVVDDDDDDNEDDRSAGYSWFLGRIPDKNKFSKKR